MSATATTGSRVWIVDPVHSSVSFTARHMMMTKVRGSFARVKGEAQLSGGGVTPLSIAAEIDASSIDTHDEQRDGHLRSADFLDAENHPRITFRSTSISEAGEAAFDVTGDLTIRSATKSVTFPVEVEGDATDPQGERRIGYSAHLRIDRREFGLTFNRALETGGVLVGNEIDIELDIEVVAARAS